VPRREDEESVAIEPARPVQVERPSEPPVVARLVVEIRSDGSRTIARGAMEDASTGRAVAIEATGRTPLQLALSLARSLVTLPAFGRAAARALLGAPRRRQPGRRGGGDGAPR
jgi:hypothetical protein